MTANLAELTYASFFAFLIAHRPLLTFCRRRSSSFASPLLHCEVGTDRVATIIYFSPLAPLAVGEAGAAAAVAAAAAAAAPAVSKHVCELRQETQLIIARQLVAPCNCKIQPCEGYIMTDAGRRLMLILSRTFCVSYAHAVNLLGHVPRVFTYT